MNKKIICEECGKNLENEEEVFKVLGINNKDFKVKIHYYCSHCGEVLVSDYRKKGKWILEN